jgi:ribosomal protein L37AE/L43A
MSQHFLLSAAARSLSLRSVARLTDEEAHATFVAIRSSDNGGEPYCPKCGCVALYNRAERPLWKCKGCTKEFSVTSGTIFASRKLPIRDILLAIAIFVTAPRVILPCSSAGIWTCNTKPPS